MAPLPVQHRFSILDTFQRMEAVSPCLFGSPNEKLTLCIDTSGRLCGNSAILNATCCLPCPAAQWVYPDSFSSSVQNASKSATLSLICCIFLLLTWILLPSPESHRHYLSVGLTFSVLLLSISFAIPLSTQPQMCYNAITPADMFSSPSCGWSGALFEAGVLASGIWVLLRVLWLHLRVCWGITAGRAFAFGSMFVGRSIKTAS